MDLPTYTNIWRIEKRLYKLYDFRLPMPVPVGQIAVFLAIAVPYVGILALIGLPFSHTLLWLYVLPPGVLAWLTTRPVLEGKRLPELVLSQLRYLTEPRTWARMAPLTEKDEITIVARVWRRAESAAAASPAPARARRRPARQPLAVPSRPAARPIAAGSGRPAPAQSAAARSAPARSAPARSAGTRSARFAPARHGRARPAPGQPVLGQPVPGQPVPGRPAPAIPAPRLAQAGVHARPDLRSRPAHAADPGAPLAPPSWPVPGVAFPAALVPPGEQFPPDLHDPLPVPASAEVPYRFQPSEPGPAGAEAAMPPGEPFQPELRARADAPLARPDAPDRFRPEPADGDAEPPSPARPFRPGALEPEPASADAQLARPYFPYRLQPEPAEGDAEPPPPPRPFRAGTLQPEPARAEAPLARPGAAYQVQRGLVEAEPAAGAATAGPERVRPEAREPELVSAEAGPVPPGEADPAAAEPDQPLVRPGQNWPVEVVEGTVTGTPGAGQPAAGAGPPRRGAGWRPAAGTGGLLRGALGRAPGESRQGRPDLGQPASARPRPAEPVQGQLVQGQPEPQDAAAQARPEVADQPVTQGQPAVQGQPVASWQPAAQAQPAVQGRPAAQGRPAVEGDEVQVVPGPAMSPPVVVPSSVQRPDTPAVPDTRGPAGPPPAIPPPTARPAADAGPVGAPARPRELPPATGRPDDPATGRPDDAAARPDPAMPAAQTAPAAAAPAASAPATSAPAAGDTWNEEAPAAGRPERDESRPVVTVTGAAAERPMRVVERALRSQQGRRGDGWRDRVVMVPGGHRPGKPDQLQRDRARARLPLREPQRIVVLGCTRGAGQTTTVLLAGDMLAGLRGEPVAVLDLNPGRGSLTEQAAAIPGLVAEPADSPRLVGAPNPAGGPALDAGLQVISGGPVPSGGDAGRIIDSVAARYTLTLADPAAGCVPRSLEVADQLMIVAPASAEAANALGMTFEWLEAHGHGRLATGAVTVLNGVSGPTAGHAERAANVATGRCRAIVKVPWDSHLKDIARDRAPYHGPDTGSAQAPAVLAAPTDADAGYQPPGPRSASLLSPALTHAYTALAGVLIAGLADPGELRSAR